LDNPSSAKILALQCQSIPNQNPKSEYRNPKQTQKLKFQLRKSETGWFEIFCFLII